MNVKIYEAIACCDYKKQQVFHDDFLQRLKAFIPEALQDKYSKGHKILFVNSRSSKPDVFTIWVEVPGTTEPIPYEWAYEELQKDIGGGPNNEQ